METTSKLKQIFSAEEIRQRVKELAAEISRDYEKHEELHVVCILKGAFVFTADLIRYISVPCRIHFLQASSYGDRQESAGKVRIQHDLNLKDKHILLVEDIVDTGLTLDQIVKLLQSQQPASLKICALLDKPEARKIPVAVHYLGFTIPKFFIVGYGIDFSERYREIPYIAELCD